METTYTQSEVFDVVVHLNPTQIDQWLTIGLGYVGITMRATKHVESELANYHVERELANYRRQLAVYYRLGRARNHA